MSRLTSCEISPVLSFVPPSTATCLTNEDAGPESSPTSWSNASTSLSRKDPNETTAMVWFCPRIPFARRGVALYAFAASSGNSPSPLGMASGSGAGRPFSPATPETDGRSVDGTTGSDSGATYRRPSRSRKSPSRVEKNPSMRPAGPDSVMLVRSGNTDSTSKPAPSRASRTLATSPADCPNRLPNSPASRYFPYMGEEGSLTSSRNRCMALGRSSRSTTEKSITVPWSVSPTNRRAPAPAVRPPKPDGSVLGPPEPIPAPWEPPETEPDDEPPDVQATAPVARMTDTVASTTSRRRIM